MHILLVSATAAEIAPTVNFLEQQFIHDSTSKAFHRNSLQVTPLVTGVGMVATTWALAHFFAAHRSIDWALNAGISGALDTNYKKGDVVHVIAEQFADLGIEEADGRFTDLFELGLVSPNDPPFTIGELCNISAEQTSFLPAVRGITVNRVHGNTHSIERLRTKYPMAQIESMESAAFFYACLLGKIPFMAIRSVSNYVEPRDRETWEINLAINNLNAVLIEMIKIFGG